MRLLRRRFLRVVRTMATGRSSRSPRADPTFANAVASNLVGTML